MRDRKPTAPAQPADQTTTKRGKTSASLGPEIQAKIGKQLRAYYAGLIEPPPERFVELLRKLDKPVGEGPSE
ncbi:MAG TPA: NepR family anti-sigma factor [Xanthobacteraceae bacterium]